MNFQQLQQHAFECLEQDNYTEAISLYKQCIDANPTEIYNYWYLGIALLLQGNEPEAQLTWLSIIAQGDSEEIDIWTAELIKVLDTEASRYQQSGNLQQAEKIYWQILQQAPEQGEAHYNLGNLLAAQGKFEQAVVLYQQALEINPSYSQPHYTLGSTLYNQGEFVDALLHYYQAISLEPDCLIYRQEFVKCLANVSFSSSVDVKILK